VLVNKRGEVLKVLDQTLGLKGKALAFPDDMPLLGNLPELDSMAVVSVITALEERFGFAIEDDEISGDTFATVGAVVRFVEEKTSP
jgi:acyl carrier protein